MSESKLASIELRWPKMQMQVSLFALRGHLEYFQGLLDTCIPSTFIEMKETSFNTLAVFSFFSLFREDCDETNMEWKITELLRAESINKKIELVRVFEFYLLISKYWHSIESCLRKSFREEIKVQKDGLRCISELFEMCERHQWKTLKSDLLSFTEEKILTKELILSADDILQLDQTLVHFILTVALHALPNPERYRLGYFGRLNKWFFGETSDPEETVQEATSRRLGRLAHNMVSTFTIVIYAGLCVCIFQGGRFAINGLLQSVKK